MNPGKTGPRCRRPMEENEASGAFPVCGRPKGHPGYPGRCLSEAVYNAQLALQAAVRRGDQPRRGQKQAAGWPGAEITRGPLPGPVPEADLFPLTCGWCKHAPATHLVITDVKAKGKQSAERHEHKVCAPCAHRDTVLPPAFVGFWLFRLIPDHCSEDEAATAAGEES